MKAQKGRVLGAVALGVALTATTVSISSHQTQAEENRMLSEEVSRLEGIRTHLQYQKYEKDSREPLSGKPLVISLITQAIKIESLDWDEEQVEAMARLCWRESRYDPNDQHFASTAYGLYQFLDSTWQYYGVQKTTDPLLQTVAAARYIEDRYETPKQALEFHTRLHAVNGELVHYY